MDMDEFVLVMHAADARVLGNDGAAALAAQGVGIKAIGPEAISRGECLFVRKADLDRAIDRMMARARRLRLPQVAPHGEAQVTNFETCKVTMGGNVCDKPEGHNEPTAHDDPIAGRHKHHDPMFGNWSYVPPTCGCGGCIHNELRARGARMAGG
jgi:hypothetical protein